jgi:anaerobic selenocysteine-containing dehydrogenase
MVSKPPDRDGAMNVYTTACPRDCYCTCGLRVTVEDGRLRAIEPHPGNRATGEGVCLKGLAYLERVYSPDRILTPLQRTPDGGFRPIPWDAALDLIASKIRQYRQSDGPQSLFYFAGTGTKGLLNRVGMEFWRLCGGCTTTYGDLCWPAGLEATRLTLGDNLHNAPWDLANARLIVMWGKNAAETNVHQMAHVDEALARGGRLIVIDPRRTETGERAELVIQPRPGTDGALALGAARILVDRGWIDREFIDRHVLGFEAFCQRLREWPVERAAAVTDVPARHIEALAEAVGTVHPLTIVPGFGLQRYTNSGQALRAMLALPVLTGQIGRPGAGWMYANLQTAVFDAEKDPLACYPPERPDGVVRVSVSTARLGRDMPAQTGPPLRLAWVERGNPIPQNPDTHGVLAAFRALEFRVVVDQFLTDTAREADLVLPAKSMFEQTDVIGAYWHPYLQLRQKLIEPPGEVKPESEIYWHLARRLGIPEEQLAGRIPAPDDAAVEQWLADKLAPFPEVTLERLREGPVLAPGAVEVAFADGRFPTPSGRIELYSEEAARRWGVDPLPDFREPAESPRRPSPESERYPLQLLTPNTKNRIHSQFNNLAVIRQFSPAPFLAIHPADAAARRIGEGEAVRVFNSRGELRLPARLDFGLKAGCVALTNGWWLAEGGAVNLLSAGRETDMGHGAAFHDNLVEVERA